MLDTEPDILPNYPFRRSMFFVFTFLFLAPVTLLTSLFALMNLSEVSPVPQVLAANDYPATQIYAPLPDTRPSVAIAPDKADARTEIIRQYLEYYNSPMSEHAALLVATADMYDLDFRLTTAIAQQESNLCKKIPPGSHNCWGWGIHSAGSLGFESYEEAIETVSRGIKQEYIDKGYNTPEEIMSKYTPLSNGSWAAGVSSFMAEMQ